MTLENNTDVSAVLFPHTSLTEQTLKRMLTLFRQLRVFVPWNLEVPDFMKSYLDAKAVQVRYPPEDTRPSVDFPKILNAYRDWSLENRDKGYTAFLKAQPERDQPESSTWGIRGELRRFGREAPPTEAPLFLKWHIILHLAREMEAQQQEADSILRNLKDKKSPLRGVLEKEDVESVFADLPHFQTEPAVGESHWKQVIDAWVGLFGGYAAENEILATFDRHVFEYVIKETDPTSLSGTAHPPPLLVFEFPDFSAQTPEGPDGAGEVGLDRGTRESLARLFGDMGKMLEEGASEREDLGREIQASFSRHPSQRTVRITSTPIGPTVEGTSGQKHEAVSRLIGKSIVLFEEVS